MSKNDLYDILGDDDFHVSETPILYPQSLEFYLNRGYIEVGNSVFESSTIETAMIGNKQVSIPVPGYATIINKLHPNDEWTDVNLETYVEWIGAIDYDERRKVIDAALGAHVVGYLD